jgi:hypothetical protein
VQTEQAYADQMMQAMLQRLRWLWDGKPKTAEEIIEKFELKVSSRTTSQDTRETTIRASGPFPLSRADRQNAILSLNRESRVFSVALQFYDFKEPRPTGLPWCFRADPLVEVLTSTGFIPTRWDNGKFAGVIYLRRRVDSLYKDVSISPPYSKGECVSSVGTGYSPSLPSFIKQ